MAKWRTYLYPILLLLCLPAEIGTALLRSTYPTQATLLVILNFAIGLWLFQQIGKPTAKLVTEPSGIEITQEQTETVIDGNARLNRTLGAGFLIFGFILTVFMLVSFALTKPRTVTNPTVLSTIIEVGFAVVFNLMIGAMVWFGAKVYLTGLNRGNVNERFSD
jgi:hypothetical protein